MVRPGEVWQARTRAAVNEMGIRRRRGSVPDSSRGSEVDAMHQGDEVTFLLTDVEGSTRLWEQDPETMAAALEAHEALAEALVSQHGGTLVKQRGEGDSLFAVFPNAPDAVAAALALQLAFTNEERGRMKDEPHSSHPALHPSCFRLLPFLKVRMALHTGVALQRGGDYFGLAVNRCARLRASAHGGQILLSGSTEEAVRGHMPAGACLQDLGEHRLRDLARPERIFQLTHPDLPTGFPSLQALRARPNNLPQPVTRFLGRQEELAAVEGLLETARLVTITGAGGTGKTRFALHVAESQLERHLDGVWLVEFDSLVDPALVPRAVAAAVGAREQERADASAAQAPPPVPDRLADHLGEMQVLIVLDNCEHLLAACGDVAQALLRACPGVTLLATSQEPLGIAGERVCRLPPLPVPDETTSPEAIVRCESMQLFLDRAAAAAGELELSERNLGAVARICRSLEGMPLAIELAAPLTAVLSLTEIEARLDDRFRLLTRGRRGAAPRHRSLAAALAWSYDLLSEPHQRLLRRLSAFAGGWTLPAAEAVAAERGEAGALESPSARSTPSTPAPDPAAPPVLELLAGLVEKSLVVAEERGGRLRYRLLETIRQYAAQRLVESGEADDVRRRHRDYFVQLAETAEPELTGPAQAEWLDQLDFEQENLRLAMESALNDPQSGDAGLRLTASLWRFWYVRGCPGLGLSAVEKALARTDRQSPGDPALRARALNGAGNLYAYLADYERARRMHVECLALRRELGDRRGAAGSLNNLALLAHEQGDYAAASACLEESLVTYRQLDDLPGLAQALNNLGGIAIEQGDHAGAASRLEQSLAIYREMGDRWALATTLCNLGVLRCRQGQHGEAGPLFAESLRIRRDLRDLTEAALSLIGLSDVAARTGRPARAARLLSAAEASRSEAERPVLPSERTEMEEAIGDLRRALGETEFDAAWAAGRALTLLEAVEYALSEQEPASSIEKHTEPDLPVPEPGL